MNKHQMIENDVHILTEPDEIEVEDFLDMPAELMLQDFGTSDALMMQTKKMMSHLIDYKELMMMYTCAIKEIRTKFDVLNTEFNVRYQRNPINFISTRMKRSSSIIEKLESKGLAFNLENIEKNIKDVAGVRVICSYVDDIYELVEMFVRQDDITLLAQKDYIANPKPNGYRSLHLIVQVPVFFANQTKKMTVEVQIRTIAMDFWASLEHQLKYKQSVDNEEAIIEELRQCAETIAQTDERMLSIRKEIDTHKNAPTDDEILFEKLRKIDLAIE